MENIDKNTEVPQSLKTAVMPSLYDYVSFCGDKWQVAMINKENTMCYLGRWFPDGWTTSSGLYLKDLVLWQD